MLNYAGQQLEIENLERFDQVAIHDPTGTDYLYTEVTIVVRALWHAQGYASAANFTGPETMESIRHTLLQPRRPLIFSADDGTVIIRSPLRRPDNATLHPVDAKTGPQPLFCNIQAIPGEETLIVDFGIRTWINECQGTDQGSPISPILSHRWSMGHTIDRDRKTKRVVAGVATFRADQMYANDGSLLIRPDDFRTWLFHPIPKGTQRTSINVEAAPDGLSLSYSFEDVERDAILDPNIYNITEVADIDGSYTEIQQAATLSRQDFYAIGQDLANASLPIGSMLNLLEGIYPSKSFNLNVRVTGTKLATRTGLVQVALRAASTFNIGTVGANLNGTATQTAAKFFAQNFLTDYVLSVGLIDHWVELRLSYKASGLTSLLMRSAGMIDANPAVPGSGSGIADVLSNPAGIYGASIDVAIGFFRATMDNPNKVTAQAGTGTALEARSALAVPETLPGVTVLPGSESFGWGPTGGTSVFGPRGSRGSSLEALATQVLSQPCTRPGTVPKYPTTQFVGIPERQVL